MQAMSIQTNVCWCSPNRSYLYLGNSLTTLMREQQKPCPVLGCAVLACKHQKHCIAKSALLPLICRHQPLMQAACMK